MDSSAMKHIWRVEGTYFHWEMTVKVRAVERPPMPITTADQDAAITRMKRVGQHFHDTVSLHEYSLEFGTLSRGDVLELTVASGGVSPARPGRPG